jgi:FMN phosphatase YigB (HAD superfamily)
MLREGLLEPVLPGSGKQPLWARQTCLHHCPARAHPLHHSEVRHELGDGEHAPLTLWPPAVPAKALIRDLSKSLAELLSLSSSSSGASQRALIRLYGGWLPTFSNSVADVMSAGSSQQLACLSLHGRVPRGQ